jgi:hypothetical protein
MLQMKVDLTCLAIRQYLPGSIEFDRSMDILVWGVEQKLAPTGK